MRRLEHVAHLLPVENFRAGCAVPLVASSGAVSTTASWAPVIGILNFANEADDRRCARNIHEVRKGSQLCRNRRWQLFDRTDPKRIDILAAGCAGISEEQQEDGRGGQSGG
jgi:hypothetical protein